MPFLKNEQTNHAGLAKGAHGKQWTVAVTGRGGNLYGFILQGKFRTGGEGNFVPSQIHGAVVNFAVGNFAEPRGFCVVNFTVANFGHSQKC